MSRRTHRSALGETVAFSIKPENWGRSRLQAPLALEFLPFVSALRYETLHLVAVPERRRLDAERT